MTVFAESLPSDAPFRPTKRLQQLLDALVELFTQEGFAHFTLDELAARLHCSKASLYRLAPSKEQLVLAVLEWRFQKFEERVEAKIAQCPSARERLIALLDVMREANDKASRALLDDIMTTKWTRDIWQEHGTLHSQRLARVMAEGVKSGEFHCVSPDFVGFAAAYLLGSIRYGIAARSSGLDDDEAYAALCELVFAGLDPVRSMPSCLRPPDVRDVNVS